MSSTSPATQSKSASEHEKFIHHIAIKLSRFLNTLNPSDGLATTVINFGKTHATDVPKFKSGMISSVYARKHTGADRFAAARTFGKFDDAFLEDLHSEIQSFAKQEEIGHFVQAPEGIIVTESDILAPDPIRKGGLVRPDKVSSPYLVSFHWAWLTALKLSLATHLSSTC
jgi:pre-mRNA-splicing factor ATP-dependent RNA helicase DHX38/PRP16